MSAGIGLLDGGTTRTRLRVWDGRHVRHEAVAEVGARDTARDGQVDALRAAVAGLLRGARARFELSALVASGMLSSASGLLEVPHLTAPVTYQALSEATRARHVEGLGDIHFVPGVKTLSDDLAACDVMRGEETEVLGLRQALGLRGDVHFLQLGSHDKLVLTSDQGVLGSVTNLNGELLRALCTDTLLRESTLPLDELRQVDFQWWSEGLRAARVHGLSRAAFVVRLAAVVGGADRRQGSSLLLGALAEANVRMVERVVSGAPLVLYGRSSVTQPLAAHLHGRGRPVVVASDVQTQQCAVWGAAHLVALQAGTGVEGRA